jgi:hypothetical protein|tara:strand:+ start:12992 stop:13834 length:843 start_codon:yes stop_codon:yes gene_type:complete
MLTVLSLGAGVQSSTLALMAAKGEITPMPDCAIFADTGAEPQGVYDYLDWLEKQLPFPVHRVMRSEGLTNALKYQAKHKNKKNHVWKKFSNVGIPLHTQSVKGTKGMLLRSCTSLYKIEPVVKKIRELLGLKKGERGFKKVCVHQWIGISTDEAARMKLSKFSYIKHIFPLIENNMSRQDCLDWMKNNKFPKPSKSACTFCPYHDDILWRDMKMNDPKSFSEAVEIDHLVRDGIKGTKGNKLYLHRSMKPLIEVDFRNAEDAGQTRLDGFDEECEGMCGL